MLRRGFKTEARALALELRAEIDLDAFHPFAPRRLAKLYGVRIVKLSEIVDELSTTSKLASNFSGALIPVGTGTLILENDSHAETRARLTLSHEMAHLTLGHKFRTSLMDERGCRNADPVQEEEAHELAGELILPFEGALKMAWNDPTNGDVAHRYEISEAAARWRMNSTGVRRIVVRTRNARLRQGS